MKNETSTHQVQVCTNCGKWQATNKLKLQKQSVRMVAMNSKMKWTVKMPLATNPVVIIDLLKIFLIVFVVVALLFTIIFATNNEIETLPPMLGMFGLICLGLLVLSWLIMLIVFGNRMEVEYEIDENGAIMRTLDKRAKLANRLAVGAGILGGSAVTTGAGLTAMSNENISIEWSWIQGFSINRITKTIALRNSWRNVMVIYCSDNFTQVCDFVKSHVIITEKKRKSPLWVMLGWTALVILVSLLMFVEYPGYYNVDLFAAIFVLLFSVASLWFIPLLSYATFAGVAWILGSTSYWLFAMGESTYIRDSEWIPFILLLLGQSVLVWIGIRLLQGKIVSMLFGDQTGQN